MPTHHDNAADAHAYRLWQARRLLSRAGYTEGPDGEWYPPDEVPPAQPDHGGDLT